MPRPPIPRHLAQFADYTSLTTSLDQYIRIRNRQNQSYEKCPQSIHEDPNPELQAGEQPAETAARVWRTAKNDSAFVKRYKDLQRRRYIAEAAGDERTALKYEQWLQLTAKQIDDTLSSDAAQNMRLFLAAAKHREAMGPTADEDAAAEVEDAYWYLKGEGLSNVQLREKFGEAQVAKYEAKAEAARDADG